MENFFNEFKKYANKAYNQVAPLIPFSNANQHAFNPNSKLHNNSQALEFQNSADDINQALANYKSNQDGTFMLNSFTKSDKQKQKDIIDYDNKFIDLATAKGYTPHIVTDNNGKKRYVIQKDGAIKEIKPSFLNDLKANSYEILGALAGVATALPHPLAKTAGVAGKILTPMVGSAVGSGAGAMADAYLNNKSVGEETTAEQLANSFIGGANNDILGAGLATAITSKPAINIAKGALKAPLEVLDKGLTGVGARHILSQNIGGAQSALKANLGGEYEARNALDSAKDALGADLDNFVSKDLKTINKTSDNRYIQKGIDIANSAINKANETLKGLNIGKADAELLLSALGHENGVKNILDAVANNPQSAQKITEISSNLNKSFAGSINEQLAQFETQTPKDSFKNSFNQVKQDYADTKDFLVKNSNYQSDFKDLNENLATILNDTQNINTRGVFNALNGGGNLENLLNAKNAINEQLSYIMRADFKSSSDFINQKALSEAKSLIDNEINTALKNDENLINLYKSANGDYATMKNIVDSNLMSQISRDGKTSLEALNAMIKSNENINGVTLNDFLSSLGAKDRAIAEANIIKNLMKKNSVNGVVDFRALNQSLNSLDFGSEFAKELRSQILNRQALLNNTSDILNALGNKVVKSKSMSQGISTDPLKRAETMKANLIIEKIKPLIPKLGNNEALKLHLNRAILNANGDFKLAIKNIDNIPDGNLPTPTRNLLNEFKEVVKEIEKQVVKADNQPNLAQNSIKGDGFVISGNGVEPKSDLNVKISVDEWVKELAGINPNKQIIADLEHLYEKYKELFSKPSEVFKLIKAVKDNPTFFYTNNQPNIALIGSILENGKLGKIGIQKDFNSDNLQVRHATYSSNAKKENERLLKRNSYPVGSPTPTQLTFGKTAEPTANGAKALLGKKEKAVSGDALPPHSDADNTSLTGRYSVGGKPHLTAFNENIIPQNAKNEVKEQAKITQINEQTAKAKSEPSPTKQEVDSLSEATPNSAQNSINGDGGLKGGFSTAEVPSTIVGGGVGHMAGSAVGAMVEGYESDGGVAGAIVGALVGLASPKAAAKIAAKIMSKKANRLDLTKLSGQEKSLAIDAVLNTLKAKTPAKAKKMGLEEAKAKINALGFNADNLEAHIIKNHSQKDTKNRLNKLYLVADTIKNFDIKSIQGADNAYVKFWVDDNKDVFAYVVTKQKDNYIASYLPLDDIDKLKNRLLKTEIFESPSNTENSILGTVSNAKSQAHNANYTPNELLNQGQVPAGWMRGSTNIGNSWEEQPKWADKFKAKMTKMGQEYSDEKIANLANWHKNSHAVTKEKDGSPKVFYHGTDAEFKYFNKDNTGNGYFFSTLKDEAEFYKKGGYKSSDDGTMYSTFLNIKKPFEMDKIEINNLKDLQDFAKFLRSKKEISQKEFQKYNALRSWVNEVKARAKENGYKVTEIDANEIVLAKGQKTIRTSIFSNNYRSEDPNERMAYWMFRDLEPFDELENGIDFSNYIRNDADIATFLLDDIRAEYGSAGYKSLKDILKAKGYDGIKFNDYQYSVFSPNQIKSISNNGAFNPRSKMMDAYTKVGLPIALVGGGLGYIGTQSIADGYKNKDTANQTKAKQYAKFLAQTKEPTQVAPNELYKAYTKAKKDIEKPTKKDKEK